MTVLMVVPDPLKSAKNVKIKRRKRKRRSGALKVALPKGAARRNKVSRLPCSDGGPPPTDNYDVEAKVVAKLRQAWQPGCIDGIFVQKRQWRSSFLIILDKRTLRSLAKRPGAGGRYS